MENKKSNLNYYLFWKKKISHPITLNLFEAERYDAAVVVQPLIGNLVYYSNQGRYEPRIAESWQQLDPYQWVFHLKQGFTCENGEQINPTNFKMSLERSFLALSKKESLPIFNKIEGFDDFLKSGKQLSGLQAGNDTLTFNFIEPVKSGLVQLLSFAPFGYICKENLTVNGEWNDNSKFISSGPYRVKEITIGQRYLLEKRPEWPEHKSNSPDTVDIKHDLADSYDSDSPGIIDYFADIESVPKNYVPYTLVPEYLNSVLLGDLKNGFFANQLNREVFRDSIEKNKSAVPKKWKNHDQSSTFYPSQQLAPSFPLVRPDQLINKPKLPLLIEGNEPQPESTRWYAWQILKSALDDLGWPYQFAKNESTWAEISNLNYDIRMNGTSVGAGFESWSLGVLFCSTIGTVYPDPSGKICDLLSNFEKGNLDETIVSKIFFETIYNDSAIIPISHFGLQWYISKGIKIESISPLISVIRFDQVELE